MNIKISTQESGNFQKIDARKLCKEAASTEEILEYNKSLAKLVFKHKEDLRYTVSASLCRMEAQTHLFDKLCKFIKIKTLLKKHENIELEHTPFWLLRALEKESHRKGWKVEYKNSTKYWKYKLQLSLPFYYAKIFAHSTYLFLCSLLSFFLLGRWTSQNKYLFLSYYDYRSKNEDCSYKDSYFYPLQKYMDGKNLPFSVLTMIVGKKSLRSFFKHLQDMKIMRRKTHIAPIENVLRITDHLSIFKNCLRHPFQIQEDVKLFSEDVSFLLQVSLEEDLGLRNNWFFAYTMEQVSEKLSTLENLEKVYYPYENHPWERILNRIRHESQARYKTMAYQHTSFSLKLLNHFPCEEDRKIKTLPEHVLTVGPVLKNFLETFSSFTEGSVISTCALRHSYLHQKQELKKSKERHYAFAFAFSSDFATYPFILKSLQKYFQNTPYKIYLKFHPLYKGQGLRQKGLGENFISAENESWDALFKKIDFLFYHDNSLGIEAFSYGIPSCEYALTGDIYDSSRVFDYDISVKSIRTFDEIDKFLKYVDKLYSESSLFEEEKFRMKTYLENYFVKNGKEHYESFLGKENTL